MTPACSFFLNNNQTEDSKLDLVSAVDCLVCGTGLTFTNTQVLHSFTGGGVVLFSQLLIYCSIVFKIRNLESFEDETNKKEYSKGVDV